jgi:hypothetical protein
MYFKWFVFFRFLITRVGRVSSFGLVTRYGPDGPEIESRGEIFSAHFQMDAEAHRNSL